MNSLYANAGSNELKKIKSVCLYCAQMLRACFDFLQYPPPGNFSNQVLIVGSHRMNNTVSHLFVLLDLVSVFGHSFLVLSQLKSFNEILYCLPALTFSFVTNLFKAFPCIFCISPAVLQRSPLPCIIPLQTASLSFQFHLLFSISFSQ